MEYIITTDDSRLVMSEITVEEVKGAIYQLPLEESS
jgi:hypothetical protein